jgi:UDP-GlcNAc:undecaprenyl-phosphate GlcNAc-1-phosphate transferase
MSKLLIFFFIFNFLLFIYYLPLSKKFNLFDYPDYIRKFQKFPIPLVGGLFIIINLILFFIFDFILNLNSYSSLINLDSKLVFITISFLFFLLGYFDDKKNLNANTKFAIMIILILATLFFDRNALLKDMRLTFFNSSINLGKFSFLITILCFLLFINAFNMLDGINGQAITYVFFILIIFLLNNIFTNLVLLLLMTCFFLFILNIQNKIYLGDSGSLTLGFIISFIFLNSFNVNSSFFADEVFLIMCIPGYELLRLTVIRILKKVNPFAPDRSHIHHLIIRKFSFVKTFVLIQLLIIFPYISYLIINNFYISFILSLVTYTLVIFIFSKNDKKIIK